MGRPVDPLLRLAEQQRQRSGLCAEALAELERIGPSTMQGFVYARIERACLLLRQALRLGSTGGGNCDWGTKREG